MTKAGQVPRARKKIAWKRQHKERNQMDNAKARDVAESLFDRNKRRETEIEGA
jgi:hypothetical protein